MNVRNVAVAGLVALGALLAAGIPGRAADIAQPRPMPAFDRVLLRGAFGVTITAGAPRASVVVTAPRDVLDRVTTEVRDRELVVGMKSGDANLGSASPHVEIALPVLRGVSNEGAGAVKIAGMAGGDLAISNSGTASISASGRADTVSIALNGVGKIDTTALEARDVTVDNNGVGFVKVRASGTLTMAVNGLGEIRYTGNPAQIERHINGIGSIGPL